MAGNPDQQEDNVDEQYQEEGEEEVFACYITTKQWNISNIIPVSQNLGFIGMSEP